MGLQRLWVWTFVIVAIVRHTRGLLPPSEGFIESYNLDYRLTWNPPADSNEDGDTSYTVLYAKRTSIYLSDSLWEEVTDCSNITRTTCNVTVVIDEFRDFAIKSVLRIEATQDGAKSRPLQVDLFPRRNVHLSSPAVLLTGTTMSSIRLRILSPLSPYLDRKDTTRRLRVDEMDSNLRNQIYFNVGILGGKMERSINTSAQYPKVEFNDLDPGASYIISARSIYQGLYKETYSDEPTVLTLSTVLSEKIHSPRDVEVQDVPIDCLYPDRRDVIVTWERPISYEPIRFFDLKYCTPGHAPMGISHVIPTEINRTLYSFRLRNLPRWSLVKVTVFANTSVTGCASFERALFPHVVDDSSSRPENLAYTRSDPDRWTFSWEAPSSCGECVAGYEVSWEETGTEGDSANRSRDSVPPEDRTYQMRTGGDVTEVSVTTLLKSGSSMTQAGEHAVLGIYYRDPIENFKLATWCLGGLIVVMVAILLTIFKLMSKRKLKKYNSSIIGIFSSSKNSEPETQLFPQYTPIPAPQKLARSPYVREPEVFDELLPAPESTETSLSTGTTNEERSETHGVEQQEPK